MTIVREKLSGEILVAGTGEGPIFTLTAPISFWGGIDRTSGLITQGNHPERGQSITGKVLAVPGTIGSSSSSAILAEVIRAGFGPAALLLAEIDAILVIGAIITREMDWPTPPVLRMGLEGLPANGTPVRVDDGEVSWS